MVSIGRSRRPGGRTAATQRRIVDATLALLVEGGLAACTFQAVAARAGVARATLYRRWPGRAALVGDALAARLEGAVAAPDTGSFAGDLAALLESIAAFLQSPLGRAALAAAAEATPEDAAGRARLWQRRLASVAPIFERAAARGELAGDCDREALLAPAVGALYFRLLVVAAPLDRDWIDRVVRRALDGADARDGSKRR